MFVKFGGKSFALEGDGWGCAGLGSSLGKNLGADLLHDLFDIDFRGGCVHIMG